MTERRSDGSKPFAEGWLNGDGEYDGRPVDVGQLRDGSLLVSDDFAGAVYRITYEASKLTNPSRTSAKGFPLR